MRAERWRLAVGAFVFLLACDSRPPPPTHRPFPEVPTLDGAVLAPLRLVTIVPSSDFTDAQAFFQFSDAVGTTQWWRTLRDEYRLGDVESGHDFMGPAIVANITEHEAFEYIESFVSANPSVAPDGQTLYLLYLPPGVMTIKDGMPNTDCTFYGAYHAPFGVRGDQWAIVQRCTEVDPIENMTISASHEIAEAATDPDYGGYHLPSIAAQMPWTEPIWNAFDRTGGAEIGDLCEGSFWVEGSFVAQRIWSNTAARRGGDPCVPALNEPYYNVEFVQDWYPLAAGGSVSIAGEGWAIGSMPAWPVSVHVENGEVSFSASLDVATLSAGGEVHVNVSAPPDAPSGSFAVLRVTSKRPMPSGNGPGLTDGAHLSYVGVYVFP
jgi:hypothetical protein